MYDVGFKFGYDGPMRGCIVGVGKQLISWMGEGKSNSLSCKRRDISRPLRKVAVTRALFGRLLIANLCLCRVMSDLT